MKRTIALALVSVVALAACSGARDAVSTTTPRSSDPSLPSNPTSSTEPRRATSLPRTGGFGSSRLRFFDDCPALLGYLRTESLARVTAWGLEGDQTYWYGRGPMMYAAADTAGAPQTTAGASTAAPSASPSYSGTNTQEVGVDEGDVVETDGSHVFVVGIDGVHVVDVTTAKVVATLDVPAGTHQLLLDGTRLLVITQPAASYEDTVVSLYDVTDAASPALLHRSHLEGRLAASRAIDGTARLVLTSALANRLPFVRPDQFGMDEATAKAQNEKVIRESTIDQWMPRLFDEKSDGSFTEMSASLDCSNVAAPNDFSGLGVTWIASIDVRGDGLPVGSAGVVSSSNTVYASPTHLYVTTQNWDWTWNMQNGVTPVTAAPPTLIHEFSLGAGGSAEYVASGEVQGHLLNQFSMSELDGDLRVATTADDYTGRGASESFVEVLRPNGDTLVSIGKVGGLGLTEQIQAVRFMGSQAYVVTFRQTDPLYVVDLSDPTAPKVTGELKIPGFSAYLHPVGDGLLLGVGQGGTDTGQTTGTQLSLFDVSDPANPQQISTLTIGAHSDAEWDHKAFLFWPEDGTIVIPTSPWWGGCPTAVPCLSSAITSAAGGAVVAQLQGTTLVGRGVIQHQERSNTGCWNPMQRSMIIGSEIVTVGMDQVKFTDSASLAERGTATWGNPDSTGCYYYG